MNNNYFESYNKRTHVIGRISSAIALVMLVGAPFLIGRMLGAMPDIGAVGKAFLSVGLVWTVSSVVEFLVYTPMLGAGGGYLAFITGNLINMKIPCAVNARDIVGAKTGTPENEIVSTLSIATSSLVTIIVLALGVALLVPLQPVLQSPTLQPAFENVVPALFAAMWPVVYFSGLLLAFSQTFAGRAAAICWIFTPLIAHRLGREKKEKPLDSGEREFLLRRAAEIWRYFRENCTAASHHLPPDNVQLSPPASGADRTSLLLSLSNEPGSLYQVLSRIYGHGINLTKLESRPIAGSDDTFRFYFDLEASVYSPELPKLLGELEDVCEHVCYLGSYSEMV